MMIERLLVILYLAACIGIGVLASRKVLVSRAEYWVAGRRIGTGVNAMAIMAALASGGSIIGVMGLAYGRGIPYTLALFAGAVLGFPLASILVAKPLRNFGQFTITDFLAFRFPHPIIRYTVPSLIVVSFTVYIVAQMKAAGITAEALLGIPYTQAVTLSALVFVLYVSIGGMLAVTWTDVVQGVLMLAVVLGIASLIVLRLGSPVTLLQQATVEAPALGDVVNQPLSSDLGGGHSRHPPHRDACVFGQRRPGRAPVAQYRDDGLQRHDSGGCPGHRADGEAAFSGSTGCRYRLPDGDGAGIFAGASGARCRGRHRGGDVHHRCVIAGL